MKTYTIIEVLRLGAVLKGSRAINKERENSDYNYITTNKHFINNFYKSLDSQDILDSNSNSDFETFDVESYFKDTDVTFVRFKIENKEYTLEYSKLIPNKDTILKIWESNLREKKNNINKLIEDNKEFIVNGILNGNIIIGGK